MMTTISLELARERREDEIRDAARRRLVPQSPMSLRRTVGRTIIRIGERMAAEPSLSLAPPR